MIEFKGECGHTIRARDEDAGKIVRCSYCGKEALVSRQPQDDLDVLFDQVEQTGSYDAQATKVGQKFHRAKAREQKRVARGKPAKAFDPFDVAMKMTYVAVVVIIAAVGFKYVPGWYRTLTAGAVEEKRQDKPDVAGDTKPNRPGASSTRRGLLTERLSPQQEGVYVSSFPKGGGIYHLPKTSVIGSILSDSSANKNVRSDTALRLKPGKHTIAIALRVNDPELMKLPEYPELRRLIESGDPGRDEEVRRFFVPDGSVSSRVERVRGLLHLVRVFECEVDTQTWTSVTAMFLPRSFDAKQTVGILPRKPAYGIDTAEAKRELEFYGVTDEEDSKYVRDALKRVGMVSYKLEDEGTHWMFRVDPVTGTIMSKQIHP